MFLQNLYGSTFGASAIPLEVTVDSIAFDGFGLQNDSIITNKIDFDNTGDIDINTFKFSRDNGGGVLSKYFRGRNIRIELTLKAPTASEFNDLLDTFKKSIRKTEGYLDITVNGEIRRIKATMAEVSFDRRHYNITYCQASVIFQAVEPFFYAKNSQSFEFLAMNNSFYGEFTNGGSVESDPKIYMIFGAGTAVTDIDFIANGKTLSITETISPGDILIIDAQEKSVTLGGIEVDYTGQFPQFSPGSCPFQVVPTGTSLMDMTIILPKNYL